MGTVSAWEPGAQDSPEAFQSEDNLESYENPPPIVLPSQGFQVDLGADCVEDSIYQHLLYIRHFLWGLWGQASPDSGPAQPKGIEGPYHTIPEGHLEDHGCPLANRAQAEELLKLFLAILFLSLELSRHRVPLEDSLPEGTAGAPRLALYTRLLSAHSSQHTTGPGAWRPHLASAQLPL